MAASFRELRATLSTLCSLHQGLTPSWCCFYYCVSVMCSGTCASTVPTILWLYHLENILNKNYWHCLIFPICYVLPVHRIWVFLLNDSKFSALLCLTQTPSLLPQTHKDLWWCRATKPQNWVCGEVPWLWQHLPSWELQAKSRAPRGSGENGRHHDVQVNIFKWCVTISL